MPKKVLFDDEQLSLGHTVIRENHPLMESEIYKSCVTPQMAKTFSPTYVR